MRAIWACVGLLAWSLSASAQEICAVSDTRAQCKQKVQAWIDEQDGTERGAQAAAAETKLAEAVSVAELGARLLAAKNTGDGTAADSGTLSDYLPLLRALLGTDDGAGGNGKIGFEWSNPLGLPAAHQNKLTVIAQRSELYEPLQAALAAASLTDEADALADDINEGDDFSIGFSYSPASATRGRDPEMHAELFSALLAIADQRGEAQRDALARRVALLNELGLKRSFAGAADAMAQEPGFRTPADLAAKQLEYVQAVEQEFRAEFDSMAELARRLQGAGFYGLLDLINNQPQLNVSANYRARDEAVGPSEFVATVSYELGWNNVNTFRQYARQCKDAQVLCLADYLNRPDVIAGLKESRRISFSAEYSQRKELDFSLPSADFSYAEAAQKRLRISAAYGRYLGGENRDRTRARIDAALSYEDYSDDPLRQNRGLATVTLTYPVAEGFFLSLGAVYATRPEFRGDVNSELGARAGFTYKVLQGE